MVDGQSKSLKHNMFNIEFRYTVFLLVGRIFNLKTSKVIYTIFAVVSISNITLDDVFL